MNLLEWKSQYSVGVAAIDDEHREMIELINDIYAKLETDSDPELVEQCLGVIFGTISMHFALEENMMKRCDYPEYRTHKRDHEELLDQIRDLMDCHYIDPVSGGRKLERCLSDWFSVHFATFDARLHGRLKA